MFCDAVIKNKFMKSIPYMYCNIHVQLQIFALLSGIVGPVKYSTSGIVGPLSGIVGPLSGIVTIPALNLYMHSTVTGIVNNFIFE